VDRIAITKHLEVQGVQTRIVFAGNITRQPAYARANMRVPFDLPNTDMVHYHAFWVGCWPGLSRAQLDYTVRCFQDYFRCYE
jgi:CDP-6-deoxy-D-xylo-4-hexulose-3-dehydrase